MPLVPAALAARRLILEQLALEAAMRAVSSNALVAVEKQLTASRSAAARLESGGSTGAGGRSRDEDSWPEGWSR